MILEATMSQLKFIALLGNADKSILQIEFGDDFHIQEWPTDKFVSFCEKLFVEDAWFKLENEWGYGHARQSRQKHVYVVVKEYKDFPNPYDKNDDSPDKWHMRLAFEDIENSYLNDKITKLRLCAEGSINLCAQYYYRENKGEIDMESASEEMLFCESRLFKIKKSELNKINAFLKTPPLRPKHTYVRFALENFLESYRVAHIELEFVISMIALETLFNDGKQELRYKISRSCAVLLGKTKNDSKEIYKNLRELYDKRSTLVHTGDKSTVNQTDALRLKAYVRRSLFKILGLNLTKQDLAMKLTEHGFGSFRRIS